MRWAAKYSCARREFSCVRHRRFLWACGCAVALLFSASIHVVADRQTAKAAAAPQRSQTPAPAATATSPALPDQALIQKYCSSCHNDRAKTGGISFDGVLVA